MDKNVWIARNNQVFGPYLFSTLTTDNVLPTDYVGESPNGPWIPAQAFDGFGGLQQHHQQPNLPTAQANPFGEHYRCICPHCRKVVNIYCHCESLACPACANQFSVVGIPIDFDLRPTRQRRSKGVMINYLGVVPMVLALAVILGTFLVGDSMESAFIPAGILFGVGFVMVLYSFTQIYS